MATAIKTETCRACKGTGKQTVQVEIIEPGKTTKDAFPMECIRCDGRRVVPKGTHAALKRADRAFWCACGKASTFGAWHEDGTCTACRKHHAHCGRCGKITQVG